MSAPTYKKQPQRCDSATEGAHSHHRKGHQRQPDTRGPQVSWPSLHHWWQKQRLAVKHQETTVTLVTSLFTAAGPSESTADYRHLRQHDQQQWQGGGAFPFPYHPRVQEQKKRLHGVLRRTLPFPFVVAVQSLSHVWPFPTPGTVACQAPLSAAISWSWLRFMSVELMMLSNHLILCHPLLLLPSVFPSIRVFSSESALCISWPKYWNFSLSLSPFSEYSGLISFRIDWLALLAVQETLKSLLQYHDLKASAIWHLAFFIVQLSHPYMTTGKTIPLTLGTFVGKVMSLIFNTLSRFGIAFLPRSKPILLVQIPFPFSTCTNH